MSLTNILVAYDETDGAKKALDIAADLARANEDIHVDVVYVIPIPLLDDKHVADFKEILDVMIEDGKKVLTNAVDSMGDAGEQADALILTGTNPATEIIKLVEDRKDYDLIIIGCRGLTGMKEYLGSVSHKVLHAVDVPVLIAK